MSLQNEINQLFSMSSGKNLQSKIKEIGKKIKESDEKLISLEAWKIVGFTDSPTIPDDAVGEKEYYYFEKCRKAKDAFFEGDFETANSYLMQAKWDFDDWALAHYLLGLVLLEQRKFKAARDQFVQASYLEPFNHRPMAIMREVVFAVLRD